MVTLLLDASFEIVGSVTDGQALADTAKKLQPDVIVTDISMPILNGIEAMSQLRESHSKARVVFLSVHEDRDFIRACFEAGALGYVTKPRMAADLLPAIQEALKGHTFISPSL